MQDDDDDDDIYNGGVYVCMYVCNEKVTPQLDCCG